MNKGKLTPVLPVRGEVWKQVARIDWIFVSNHGRVQVDGYLTKLHDTDSGKVRTYCKNYRTGESAMLTVWIEVVRLFSGLSLVDTSVEYLDGEYRNCRIDNLVVKKRDRRKGDRGLKPRKTSA